MNELETQIIVGLGIFFGIFVWVMVIYIEIHNHLERKKHKKVKKVV